MRTSVMVTLALGLLVLAGCERANRITASERADLSCLASRIVVQLTDRVRAGFEAGQDAGTLNRLQAELTAEGLLSAKYLFPSKHMHQAFYEFDVARRAIAVQTALKDEDPQSPAHALMDETLAMGRSCVIEGLPR